MAATEDLQQSKNAELKQAFANHLPKRLALVQRRCRELCTSQWDMHTLSTVYDDIQSLAGSAGTYGLVEASEQLFSLEVYLSSFIEGELVPSEKQLEEIARLANGLDEFIGDVEPEPEAEASPTLTPVAREASGEDLGPADPSISNIPDGEVPPEGYIPVAASEDGVEPSRATSSGSGEIAFLRRGDGSTLPLIERLGDGFQFTAYESVEDCLDMLRSSPPSALIVGSRFLDRLEPIGDAIGVARRETGERIPLVAFSPGRDLSLRLTAMRAGADAFLLDSADPEAVSIELRRLLQDVSSDPYRVLIVEDDRSEALFASSILRKAGMKTHMVLRPLQIMDALEEFEPDLILMDLYMPDCDGIELTSIIREHPSFISTPIVFLSGEQDTDKQFDAINAGGDDFLSKPIRPRHLISAVTNRVKRLRAMARRLDSGNVSDTVTGLYDRPFLLDRVSAALARDANADRGGVLYLELDAPFEVRDEVGLASFDDLMNQIGSTVADCVSADDFAARFSDNAFTVLAPQRDVDAMVELAEELARSVSDSLYETPARSVAVRVSVGVCPFSAKLGDAGSVIAAAERACASARNATDRVVELHVTTAPPSSDDRELELIGLLEEALKNDQFQLVYQPVVSLKGVVEEQYQALVRLRHSEGTLQAGEFIPLAEERGMIVDIDRWVLGRAVAILAERARQNKPMRLFVNQSGQSLAETGTWLKKALEGRQLDGAHLALEYKLPDIVSQLKSAKTAFDTLAGLNAQITLGAFDGSDTAFQLLEHLHVDVIKLSPDWADESSKSLHGHDIKSIVNKLHDLDKKVIVPAIEDAHSAARLWTSGTDYIQGNFVQQPDHELRFDFRESAF